MGLKVGDLVPPERDIQGPRHSDGSPVNLDCWETEYLADLDE